ncbi:hypothetical protein PCANC_23932 [Puccinia coronata f. sp. avenae]|uniref:Uncharacterized protein n=1 Tax=Puccinia coronata f. sp. avenae TaxID=200324 RepID=A0A2N5TX71_9BASI|nr:hypothetical protein PCANC_23932 [Puccinia coronata f. sp. avenae]
MGSGGDPEQSRLATTQSYTPRSSYLRPQLESYVNKLGEDDFARLFEEHPSAIYNQLTTLAQDSDRIPYALNTYQNALSKDDYEALKEASANRRVFRKKLQESGIAFQLAMKN